MGQKIKRILIIGSCGAGKSLFAKKLSEKTGLPIIHLDKLYWQPNWIRTPREIFRQKVKELVKQDRWIMDGNYRNTLDLRIPAADLVVWLVANRFTCLSRIIKRRIRKDRVDKLNNCKEQINFELLKWILFEFPYKSKRDIKKYFQDKSKRVVYLRTNREKDSFVNNF